MCAASSLFKVPLSDQPAKVVVEGGAKVRFGVVNNQTVLKDLYQHDPVRILFPDNPPGELTVGVLTTTSGGLVGGDKVTIEVDVADQAEAMIMAQAAEKIYRSTGADCQIDITIRVDDNAWFEWLPQETILHQGARLRRQTNLNLDAGARVMAGEFLVFGRHAMGEKMTEGLVRDCWRVDVDNKTLWTDAFHLDGDISAVIDHPAGLAGATGLANTVYAGPDAADYLDLAREILGSSDLVRSAATVVNGVLLVRWIGKDVFSLRNAFADFWKTFRNQVGGKPEKLPRLWDI